MTAKLIPWDGNQPVWLTMPGSPILYLPVFSTEYQLRETMSKAGVFFQSIKQIEDGPEFLQSVVDAKEQIAVIVDPYFLPNGRVRFTQIQD